MNDNNNHLNKERHNKGARYGKRAIFLSFNRPFRGLLDAKLQMRRLINQAIKADDRQFHPIPSRTFAVNLTANGDVGMKVLKGLS